MSSNTVGIIGGRRLNFLDHIIPLCHKLQAPLYCSDPWIRLQAEIWYPEMEFADSYTPFETFLYVQPYRLHEAAFLFEQQLFSEKRRSIFSLHGNSNKNRDSFWIERILDDDEVWLYGNFMKTFLEEKGVYHRLKSVTFIGNERRHFYEEHRNFFQQKLAPHLPKLENKVALYAPTWRYPMSEYVVPSFLERVPEDWDVLVKLHPYLLELFPELIEKIRGERVHLLGDTPLIYPLFESVDVFIGDMSSVCYDFLSMDRPLYFLTQEDPYLAQVGTYLPPHFSFEEIVLDDGKGALRGKLYQEVYGD